MPLIAAAGRRFHVQRLGGGAPVVLIHGLVIGNLATWFFGVAPLLARHRSVLLYDQRGHGLSAAAESGYDLASGSADLASLLDAVEGFAHEVDVVGHSWGGTLALRFAIDRPERVRRVVVLDAPLPPFDPAEVASMMDEVDAEQLERVLALDHGQFSELAARLAVGRGRRGVRRADRARAGGHCRMVDQRGLDRGVSYPRRLTLVIAGHCFLRIRRSSLPGVARQSILLKDPS